MMVLLNEALLPNLVQTTEGAPAIVHCGPFANIAHGTSSVLAQRMGLHLADYVVNETGFAADLGAEKFFDIVMPMCGHVPSVAVRDRHAEGAARAGRLDRRHRTGRAGFPNLQRHLENLQRWGVPAVVALNRFPGDARRRSRARARVLRDARRGGRVVRGLRARRRRHDGSRGQGRRRGRRRQIPTTVRRSTTPSSLSRRRSRDCHQGLRRRRRLVQAGGAARGCSSSRRSATASCRSASRRRSIPSPTIRR